MKKILCYGDSNTFGLVAVSCERYAKDVRWSGTLKYILQDTYEVIEQGLSDRNGFIDNPKGDEYCALKNLPKYLSENPDINIIILAIGTNDLQFTYDFNDKILVSGLQKIIDEIKIYNNLTRIIIIPPVKLTQDVKFGFFGYQFNDLSIARSNELFYLYKEIADKNNCGYFDFNDIAQPSPKDGLHYTPISHRLIADKLAKYIINFDK